jgi:thiamine-phosphate pyrophosphorylase
VTQRPAAPLIYLITDRRATDGRPLGDVIGQALLGVRGRDGSSLAVQVREKDLGGRALLTLALDLRARTAAAGVRLFVNDRVDVALAVGADGVHLGQGALSVDDVHAIAPRLQIAVSTHAVDEVARAATDDRITFVVFGPVFDTPSKRAFGPPPGIERLRDACAENVPVLALGGIGTSQIALCWAAGASGIACIRAVLRNSDPEMVVNGFFETIEST